MKLKPILFSVPMVMAILAEFKNQTRRKLNPQPPDSVTDIISICNEWVSAYPNRKAIKPFEYSIKNKYFIGDVLWVKETFYAYGKWVKNGISKTGKQKWLFKQDSEFTEIRYFDNPPAKIEQSISRITGWYKRPSLFMPFKFSRIFLEITDTRVERLQDISKEDAIAEGIERQSFKIGRDIVTTAFKIYNTNKTFDENPIISYWSLWDMINGDGSWKSNPFVFVVKFKKIEKP